MINIIKKNFIVFLIIFTFLYLIIAPILNIYVPCVFNEITGLYCPGCGVTRMLKSMLHLEFYQAFRYNPLLFIFSPFILFMIINYIYCYYKKKKSLLFIIPKWILIILLIIVFSYWILRNIIPYLEPTVV